MPTVKEMIASPKKHFKRPADVVADETLSDAEKKEILDVWEHDQIALDASADEGMLPERGESSDHRAIREAQKRVAAGTRH